MKFLHRNRGTQQPNTDDESATSPFLTKSPRSVGDKLRHHLLSSPPINADGDFYDSIAGERVFADLTEEPSETYDFSMDAYLVESSPSSPSNVPKRRTPLERQRSQSVQRRLQGNAESLNTNETDRNQRRSNSTGRAERRRPSIPVVAEHEPPLTPNSRKKKSKMEKIFQLQEKNQRYKDEFRKVQKDRKSLKKSLVSKQLEIASLTKEIETHEAESSVLKMKLRDAILELDKSDHGERRDRLHLTKLQRELTQVRSDYNAAMTRIARMREEVESFRVSVERKDHQIRSLTSEVTEQNALIDALQMEIVQLRRSEHHVSTQDEIRSVRKAQNDEIAKLTDENTHMKQELSGTLQRASDMVKEREEAISELLKENEELKARLERDAVDTTQEDLTHLREELEASAKTLEASQDRNVLLEEELESWISRGQETETELLAVREESEDWQRKADSAMNARVLAEAKAKESTHRADSLEATVKELRQKHLEHLQAQEKRHTEELLDQKEKLAARLAESDKAELNPQDMMLQKAVADRKAKDSSSTKPGWGTVIQQFRNTANDMSDEPSEDRKRMMELERDNADKEEELNKAKSEVVRMRSSYNDTLYVNKKRIEELEKQNEEYVTKLRAMEIELGALRKARSS